jgi:hypothetical protein
MLTLIISTAVAGIILASFAWIGIGHYKLFSEDEDKEKTAFTLRSIIFVILLVLLSCSGIMGVNACTKDHPNTNVLESPEKK